MGLWWPGVRSNRRPSDFQAGIGLSGEVVQGRIRAQERGIRPLPSGDFGARVSKSVGKPEPGRRFVPAPQMPSRRISPLQVRSVALQLQV